MASIVRYHGPSPLRICRETEGYGTRNRNGSRNAAGRGCSGERMLRQRNRLGAQLADAIFNHNPGFKVTVGFLYDEKPVWILRQLRYQPYDQDRDCNTGRIRVRLVG